MRTIGVALIALFALSLLGWAITGEWEGTAEFEIISDVAGISEESLDIATDASLELSFDGLDIEIISSFNQLISDIHSVNGAISDIEKLKKRKALKGKDELKYKLEVAITALEQGQNAEAVAQLLHFIDQVEAYREEGEFTTKEADSLISKAETIIGKIDKGKSERDLELNISATIAEVELTWELETEGAIFPAPGKDNRDITFNFEADAGLNDLDLTLEMEHQQLDFFERWTKEKGKLADGLNFEAELDLGDLEITRALDYEGTLFPEGIGKEIEAARVDEAKRAIERLRQEIENSPSLPDGIKEELTDKDSKLKKAIDDLDKGQRGKAVGHLWDFIELVERRRREEKISEDDANWLVTEAREILPRKRIGVITATTKAALDFDEWELEMEHESTIKDLPAETKKDERSTNIKAELEVERAPLSLKGTSERQRKLFPNDRKKDELVRRRQVEMGLGLEKMEVCGTFSRKATEYPNKIAKNNVIKTRELELKLELGHADCTLSFERETTSYPHDATKEKDKLVDDRELKLEFEQPEFTIDLERKTTTYPNDPVKDKLVQSAEFQLDWEITTDLQLSLTADFVMTDYPNDPVKDKTSASLKVTIQQEF